MVMTNQCRAYTQRLLLHSQSCRSSRYDSNLHFSLGFLHCSHRVIDRHNSQPTQPSSRFSLRTRRGTIHRYQPHLLVQLSTRLFTKFPCCLFVTLPSPCLPPPPRCSPAHSANRILFQQPWPHGCESSRRSAFAETVVMTRSFIR